MCFIRIPFNSKSEDGESLQRCIDFAVEGTGYDAYAVTKIMSYFVQAIADEMASGHPVSIPGFGLFGAVPIPAKHLRMSRDTTPRCKPVFSPSRGLRNEVAVAAPVDGESARRFNRHKKNHSDTQRAVSARVFTSMEALRENIAVQMGGTRD